MKYNFNDSKGEAMGGIRFQNTKSLTPDYIIKAIEEQTEANRIPAEFSIGTIKSGGLFGKTYPCVLIAHPNPPQSYFKIMIIINEDILSFHYWGFSKLNYNTNRKEMFKQQGTLTGMIRGALTNVDQMAFQQEQVWYDSILGAIKACTY